MRKMVLMFAAVMILTAPAHATTLHITEGEVESFQVLRDVFFTFRGDGFSVNLVAPGGPVVHEEELSSGKAFAFSGDAGSATVGALTCDPDEPPPCFVALQLTNPPITPPARHYHGAHRALGPVHRDWPIVRLR
jgi:hypothetical protein